VSGIPEEIFETVAVALAFSVIVCTEPLLRLITGVAEAVMV
jgi:hypothetical protein